MQPKSPSPLSQLSYSELSRLHNHSAALAEALRCHKMLPHLRTHLEVLVMTTRREIDNATAQAGQGGKPNHISNL